MNIFLNTGKNCRKYLFLFAVFSFIIILRNETNSQILNTNKDWPFYSAPAYTNSTKTNFFIRLKTEIIPRRGEVAFLKKAVEIIVTPVDTFGNEIKSIPDGLIFRLFSNAPEDISESNFNGNRTIFGKYYTYITPNRIHDQKNLNELQIGAFLMGSDGLPDHSTGQFDSILVVHHMPKRPDTSTFQIYSYDDHRIVTNEKIRMRRGTDQFMFSWSMALDSNDKSLIKSYRGTSGEILSINDSCVVRYKLGIKEYPFSPFPISSDTSKNIILTARMLNEVCKYIIGSMPISRWTVSFHWYIIVEDEVYKTDYPAYRDFLTTSGKRCELYFIPWNRVTPNIEKLSYSLSQNYPNPFNPSTNISYSLPEKYFVDLRVYDILGKEVAVLVNETKPAGEHSVLFDAGILPSGIYYYKIHAGNCQDMKKMLFLK